ncbi:MAG: VIT1/CCC1 transporter family protein [Candidatus Kapaibacterium sp.]
MEPIESRDALIEHRASHTPEAVALRLDGGPEQGYLKDFIYGAIDGAVTTFAVVSGVAGAGLSSSIVIVLGVANLLADGFSMAVSNYLGTKAELERQEKTRREEQTHIKIYPEGEREEIRQIFARKGFEGEELERVVDVITSDDRRWVDTMLQEEHGLALEHPNPFRAAVATFIAFFLVGGIPLLTFLWNMVFNQTISNPFLVSSILTGVAFFAVGAMKSRVVEQRWYSGGIETFLVGGAAALLAYLVGVLLKGTIGV